MNAPLRQHILDFMWNNMDPDMPFSDRLDASVIEAKAAVLRAFSDYEAVAEQRRHPVKPHVHVWTHGAQVA